MKRLILICAGLTGFSILFSQEPSVAAISKMNNAEITLRPNSRDYAITRIGNNYQRIIQIRSQAMTRYKKAMMNRKTAIQRRRNIMNIKMNRQRRLQQHMIRQNKNIIQQRRRMRNQ
jgi:hypothetical protein